MFQKVISIGAVAFALTAGAATVSSAATCGSALSGVGNFVEGQTDCVSGDTIGTANGGNPRDSYIDMFGMGKTWNVLNTTNLGQPQAEGNDTTLQFSGFSVQPDNGGTVDGAGTMGTWSVTSWPANTLIAFALKGGSDNGQSGGGSTFHLMSQSTTSGKWYMNPAALSNFRLFTAADDNDPGPGPGPGPGPNPNPAPVPLPAAGWMLLAAIGGMAFWRRRATA